MLCCAHALRLADCKGSPVKGKLVQAASFWTCLCICSCSMPAASLSKLDATSQSWVDLPALFHYHRPVATALTGATNAFCATKIVQRKVCWFACCARKDRRSNTELGCQSSRKLLVQPLLLGPTVQLSKVYSPRHKHFS